MDYEPVCIRIVSVTEETDGRGSGLRMVGSMKGEFTELGPDAKPVTRIIAVQPTGLNLNQRASLWALYKMRRFKTYIAECAVTYKEGAMREPVFIRWRTPKQVENCEA